MKLLFLVALISAIAPALAPAAWAPTRPQCAAALTITLADFPGNFPVDAGTIERIVLMPVPGSGEYFQAFVDGQGRTGLDTQLIFDEDVTSATFDFYVVE